MHRLRYSLIVFVIFSFAQTGVALEAREEIHASADLAQPVLPGMTAPSFTVLDVHGDEFHFDPGVMEKPLVLTFFRGGWCPFCNLHLA